MRLDLCAKIRSLRLTADVPVIIVDRAQEVQPDKAVGVTDWLIWPFSSAYARTRIRAWLLRTAVRWERAPLPPDEEERLATLHNLRILDTPREQRFDRLTRLAAGILGVPIALVSLVDRERQWFKSAHGLSIEQTPREISFCAHAVAARRLLVVSDTFDDNRFADNPGVTGDLRIRFYAGCPLFVEKRCVGTRLCVGYAPSSAQCTAARPPAGRCDLGGTRKYTTNCLVVAGPSPIGKDELWRNGLRDRLNSTCILAARREYEQLRSRGIAPRHSHVKHVFDIA